MNKRKTITWLISILAIISLQLSNLSVAVAAVKNGSPCKSKNVVVKLNSTYFKCVSSKGKWVWKIQKKSTDTSISFQSTAANESSNQIDQNKVSEAPKKSEDQSPAKESPKNVELPPKPTSFEDLVQSAKGISYWSWKLVQERKGNLTKSNVNFVLHIGPNTNMLVKDPLKIVQLTSDFFSSFPQVKTAHIVFFDFPDQNWAINLDRNLSQNPRPNEVSATCSSATLCNGGNAYVDNAGTGFSYISASETNKDIFQISGPVVSHEYFHNIQFYPLIRESSLGKSVVYMPDWIREGSAHWFSVSLLNENFEDVLKYQKENAEFDLYRNKISASDVAKVFSINDGRSDNGWLAYNVGSKAIEALVLIGGIDSIIELYLEGASGVSFENAFKKIYKLDWVTAKPILAEAISKIYS